MTAPARAGYGSERAKHGSVSHAMGYSSKARSCSASLCLVCSCSACSCLVSYDSGSFDSASRGSDATDSESPCWDANGSVSPDSAATCSAWPGSAENGSVSLEWAALNASAAHLDEPPAGSSAASQDASVAAIAALIWAAHSIGSVPPADDWSSNRSARTSRSWNHSTPQTSSPAPRPPAQRPSPEPDPRMRAPLPARRSRSFASNVPCPVLSSRSRCPACEDPSRISVRLQRTFAPRSATTPPNPAMLDA
jgi:hypothetical protein